MYYVAFVTDYDGTIAHEGIVDPETIAALERIKETGRKIVLVTGRELQDLKLAFPECGLFDCIVAENGAVLYFPASEAEHLIAPEPPAAFVDRLRQMDVEPLSIGRSIVATWEPNETIVLEAIRELGLELHIVFNKGAVMVLPANINKASGLTAALAKMDISPLNAIGIGDAENDHAFLRACGCAVAVANALSTVKAEADILTESPRGAGVREIVARLVSGEEGEFVRTARRHRVIFGRDEQGEEAALYPSRDSILISGRSGAGKSTISTVLLEKMMELGFQFCVFDPEGDYAELEGAVVLGDAKVGPRSHEVFDLLKNPGSNVVVNMIGIDVADRPRFFAKLLPELSKLRAATGRPHWILVDEAHHMLPATKENVAMTLPKELPSAIVVTVHPETLSLDVLDMVGTILGVGDAAREIIERTCHALGEAVPAFAQDPPAAGQAIFWRRRSDEDPRLIDVDRTRQAHHRHTRKYAQGSLGEDKSFYFRGPKGALNLRAQNLMLFVQITEGIDEDTWVHHLRAGDYSDWFRRAIKDEDLANEAEAIEGQPTLDAEQSRKQIIEAVKKRYTAPASVDDD